MDEKKILFRVSELVNQGYGKILGVNDSVFYSLYKIKDSNPSEFDFTFNLEIKNTHINSCKYRLSMPETNSDNKELLNDDGDIEIDKNDLNEINRILDIITKRIIEHVFNGVSENVSEWYFWSTY